MNDLRERVAMAIEASLHNARLTRRDVGYLPEADAAIALVLEEAAKACERRFMGDHTREDMEARRCAAAIRALEDKA